mgnify:FL=1
MTPNQERAAAIKSAQDLVAKAQAESRDFTADERAALKSFDQTIEETAKVIEGAKESAALMAKFSALGAADQGDREAAGAKSLGEHFVKSVGETGLSRVKSISGTVVAAPEFKAAGDTQSTPGVLAPWLTEYDQTIVRAFRRPVISDLLGSGTLSGNAITYLVEGAIEGGFTTVAEGGAKPQFHIGAPTTRTDALKKIAGFLKFTDEMVEDAPFWVSEINERGLYMLALAEENQLLNGDGTGANVLGLLNRSGVQTIASAKKADNADAIYRAITAVQAATGLAADGLIINPVDYEALRLGKDGNGQYFGGGYFQGQYGQGGVEWQPPVWGLRTVVTAAAPAGSPVVGAFNAASTVYRKGGVRVESTNSHVDDFTNNLVTTRIEERVGLAVRFPSAVAKVTLSAAVV